jgi:hypothetical protein
MTSRMPLTSRFGLLPIFFLLTV